MGLPILIHLLPQGILVGLNFQPPFWKFTRLPLVLVMVANMLALNPYLTGSILDVFPGANFSIEQLFESL